jgi:DNA polymerase III, delta subunit
MYQDIVSCAPEQIFLLQGNSQTFSDLVENITTQIPFVESVKLARFTIGDASDLVSFNLERNINSWMVIYFDVFLNDAAQVLLKTLEEPKQGIYIIFVTPHPYLIPQTIRSRVRILMNNLTITPPLYFSSKELLLSYIKETFADDNIEASERRAQASIFLDELEQYVCQSPEKLKIVYEAKDMLFKANMPTKQVVEYAVSMVY